MHNIIQNSYIFQRRDFAFFISCKWRPGAETCSNFIHYVSFAVFYVHLLVTVTAYLDLQQDAQTEEQKNYTNEETHNS